MLWSGGARPGLALAAAPLFMLAWWLSGSLVGDTAALALSALACVTLGVALTGVVAPRWLKLGVYAMAIVDTVFVVADLLQGPNATLVAAGPPVGLPRLRAVYFGQATMGFGDVFIAAVVGALLAREPRSQMEADVLVSTCATSVALTALTMSDGEWTWVRVETRNIAWQVGDQDRVVRRSARQ